MLKKTFSLLLILVVMLSMVSFATAIEDVPPIPPPFLSIVEAPSASPLPTVIEFGMVSDPSGSAAPTEIGAIVDGTSEPSVLIGVKQPTVDQLTAANAKLSLVNADVWNMATFNDRPSSEFSFYGYRYPSGVSNNTATVVRKISHTLAIPDGMRYGTLELVTDFNSVSDATPQGVEDNPSMEFAIDDRFSLWFDGAMKFRYGTDLGGTSGTKGNQWDGWTVMIPKSVRTLSNVENGSVLDILVEEYCNSGALGKVYFTGTQENRLTVLAGTGGTISIGQGLYDGNNYTGWYPLNQDVRIQANPEPGYIFAGWSRLEADTVPDPLLPELRMILARMTGPMLLKAHFVKIENNLKLVKTVSGQKSITATVGARLNYEIAVDNSTSNVSQLVFELTDSFNGGPAVNLLPEGTMLPMVIDPGETVVIASYSRDFNEVGAFPNTAELGYLPEFMSRDMMAGSMLVSDGMNDFPPMPEYQSLTSQADVTIVPATIPSPPPPPPPPVGDVTLTVIYDGVGISLPVEGSYSRSINSVQVFNSIQPAEGWAFDGLYLANGTKLDGLQVLMDTSKTVIVKFVQLVEVQDVDTPQAAPLVPETEMVQEPEPVIDTVVEEPVLDEVIPLDVPVLPKTSGVPLAVLLGFGILLTTGGLKLRK